MDVTKFGVDWKANRKAWMTRERMTEWLEQLDGKMMRQNRKVLLFLDIKLNNVKVMFFPPNVTSLSQPLDQGVIQNFKVKYRQLVLKHIVSRLDEDGTSLQSLTKELNVFQAICWITNAWKQVSTTTIQSCFRKAGFPAGNGEMNVESDISDEMNTTQNLINSAGYTIGVNDYVCIDLDILTECSSEDAKMILQSIQENENGDDDNHDSDDDDDDGGDVEIVNNSDVPPIMSYSEALDSSIGFISTLLGCLTCGPLLDRMGRRRTLLLVNFPFVIGWLLMWVAPKPAPIALLYFARLLNGLGGGMISIPGNIYIAEMSTSSMRCMLVTWPSLAISVGIILVYALGLIITEWRYIAAISTFVPIITTVSIYFYVRESPIWLLARGRVEEAEESFKWIREVDKDDEIPKDLVDEFERIIEKSSTMRGRVDNESVDEPGVDMPLYQSSEPCYGIRQVPIATQTQDKVSESVSSPYSTLLRSDVWKPLVILNLYFFFMQFSGVPVLISYAVNIMMSEGVSLEPYLATLLLGIVKLIFEIGAGFVQNRPHIDVSLTCEHDPKLQEYCVCPQNMPQFDSEGIPNQAPEMNKPMILNGPTSRNREGSDQVSVEAKQLGHLYLSIDQETFDPSTGEPFGRRPLSIASGMGMAACMVGLGLHHQMFTNTEDAEETGLMSWVPLLLIFAYVTSAAVGFFLIPWAMLGEVYPTKVAGLACGITTCLGNFFGFASIKLFPTIVVLLGGSANGNSINSTEGVFYFYGGVTAFAVLFIYIYLPETFRRTLQEISDDFTRPSRRLNFI
ncbi:hypothetical protein ANN_20898 [Periplaneta americana]|uniref:Major facilitator superfamily (MFS) profile domain-containing protein n=1 Tax=Periplaneta americana TaxID=6978 RepID=A0ABQ8SE12_PERAM|nr:hypothetical protein ANN_20898 [Periplaneta americana]